MAYGDGVSRSGLVDRQTVTIAESGTVSTALDMGGHGFMAILLPAAFTGVALTFQASHDGTTYTAVYGDDGNAVSLTVAQGRFVGISSANMAKLAAFRYLKLVSGSSEAAARTIEVVLK